VLDTLKKHPVLAILLFSFLLRLVFSFFVTVTGDPAGYLTTAKFMADNLRFPYMEPVDQPIFWYPPVFHIIYAVFFFIGGLISETFSRHLVMILGPIFGTLSLWMGYLVTKKLFNEKIGFYVLVFLSFFPPHIFYSVSPFVDILLFLFLLLPLYFFLSKRYILGSIFFAVALLTKYHALFLLPTLFVIIVINERKVKPILHKTIILGIGCLIGCVWFLRNWIVLDNPVYFFLSSFLGGKYVLVKSMLPSDVSLLHSWMQSYLHIYADIFSIHTKLMHGIMGVLIYAYIAVTLILTALCLYGAVYYLRKAFRKKRLGTHIYVLGVLFLSYFLMNMIYITDVKTGGARLLFPIYFVLGVFFAFSMTALKNKKIRLGLILLFVLAFYSAQGLGIHLVNNTWDEIGVDIDYINEHIPAEEKLLVFNQDTFLWISERQGLDMFIDEGGTPLSAYYNLTNYIKGEIALCDYGYVYGRVITHDQVDLFYERLGYNVSFDEIYANPVRESTLFRIDSCAGSEEPPTIRGKTVILS